MTNNQIDRVMGGIILAIGGLTMIGAWRMPRFENLNASPWEFVGLTPMVIGFCLAVCGVILAVQKPKTDGDTQATEQGYFDDICGNKVHVKRFVSALAVTLIYGGVLFGNVDFIWATGGFLFAFFMIFTWFLPPSTLPKTTLQKAVIKSLLFAIIVTVVIYMVFEKIFLVPLP